MKYKVELSYTEDIDKTIRYDQVAKGFNKYSIFYIETPTAYPAGVTIATTNSDFPEYTFTSELESIYTKITDFFTQYDNSSELTVLLLDESYTVKVSLLLSYNVVTDVLINNITDAYLYEVYNNQLTSIKPPPPPEG